jgi:rhamnose transport system permease protein
MRLPRGSGRILGLLATLCVVMIVMACISPYFLQAENLLGFTRHVVEIGIIACGMTFVIMTGGIDLSVGSILGLAGILMGYAWKAWGLPLETAMLLALFVGLACGALNGFLVARWRFPALVATLATMALFRGIAMVISHAEPVSNFPDWFAWPGQGYVGLVPVQLLFWIAVVAGTVWVAAKTRTGRYLVAIGDNERAARFAAVSVAKVTFRAYAFTGVLCGIAAIIYTSRFATAKADAGLGLELEAITAVVLGGTRITGGRGTALGTFLGVLILGVVQNGLELAGISSVWQSMLTGAILIVTAVVNQRMAGRRG